MMPKRLTSEQVAGLLTWAAARLALGSIVEHRRRADREWRVKRNEIGTLKQKAAQLGISESTLHNYLSGRQKT
jgi:hypothetical protein